MLLYFLLCLIQYYSLSTPSLLRCVLRIYDWLWCQLRILEASKWETTGGGGEGRETKTKDALDELARKRLLCRLKLREIHMLEVWVPPQMKAIGISCVSRWTNASQNLIHTCDIKGVIIAPTRATALQKPRPRARTTVG